MSSDIYQDSFNYCTPEAIRRDLERLYPVNRVPSRRDPALRQKIIVFNHMGLSGGAPINDVMARASTYSGVRFLIPAHADVWDAGTYGAGRPVFASAHYLNGLHERIDDPCAYFTVIRDPVRLMGSFFLRRPYVFSGHGLNHVWATLDRHLDEWKETAGHLNLQTFEIATNDFDKPFRQWPGGPPDVSVHDIRNPCDAASRKAGEACCTDGDRAGAVDTAQSSRETLGGCPTAARYGQATAATCGAREATRYEGSMAAHPPRCRSMVACAVDRTS